VRHGPARRWSRTDTSHEMRGSSCRLLWVAAVLCALLVSGCGVHTGGSEVAYLRGDQLWVALSDGSDARMLASGGIVSFAWSPDHHSLVYRVAPGAHAAGSADAPGAIYAMSINGGYPLQITPDDVSVAFGDPVWDADGNRVLYREANVGSPDAPLVIVSQTDQPLGLARRIVANAASASILALSADGQQVAEIDGSGNVLVGSPGGQASADGTGALRVLPQTGRPGRVWWQPKHTAVLYAVTSTGGVALTLHVIGGATRTIASVNELLDASFSPDGTRLLVRTPSEFEVWSVAGGSSPLFKWPESDPYALPWWSPDGRLIVVAREGGLARVNVATHAIETLLSEQQAPPRTEQPQFWRVAVGSPFSPDGGSIVFAAAGGATWQGKTLDGTGAGLFTVTLTRDAAGVPLRIADSMGSAPSWGYSDPATEFLVGEA
jgi:hypothetical protein